MGLGYPSLARYDPRLSNTDSAVYYRLVVGEPPQGPFLRYRILVPLVARSVYWLARDRVGSWDPVLLGLLVANAIFCATTVSLLVVLGDRLTGDHAVALLAGALYLLNFAVPNFQLAGLVDSAEAAALMALAWAASVGAWPLLPLIGVLGAAAKESFLPLGVAFAAGWWVGERRTGVGALAWIAAMAVTATITVFLALAVGHGRVIGPAELYRGYAPLIDFPSGIARIVADRGSWYVLGWLVPLGMWRLRCLPRAWRVAAALAAVAALALGARVDAQGNNARAIFNAAGPLLSLSTALLLARPGEGRTRLAAGPSGGTTGR
jgi:hypothetical protein